MTLRTVSTFPRCLTLAAGIALAASGLSSVALAAGGTGVNVIPVAADTAAPEPRKAWVRECGEPTPGEDGTPLTTCLTSNVLFDEAGKLVASVAVETVTGRAEPRMLLAVPTGVLLIPGVKLQVDDALSQKVDYRICFSDRCFADLEMDAAFMGQMRRGTELKVAVLALGEKTTTLTFELKGFAAALDGQAVPETAGAPQEQPAGEPVAQ